MKLLGLIGGMSWLSTIEYYKLINQEMNIRLGGLNSSNSIIYSFNFADMKESDDTPIHWDKTFGMISTACNLLQSNGVKAIVLCAVTAHFLADQLQQQINIP